MPDTQKISHQIAVVLHLYYQDLWAEFAEALQNLQGHNFDLFVTLTKGAAHQNQTEWLIQQIIKAKEDAYIFVLPNKGTDNGPFLHCLNAISELGDHYDYLLKLHSKKSLLGSSEMWLAKTWRQELIQPLIGSRPAVQNCLEIFATEPTVGMLGAKKHISTNVGNNRHTIAAYQKMLGIRCNAMTPFVGGNMWWIRFSILQKLLQGKDISKLYGELEEGYVTDKHGGTRTHALERIWSYAVTNAGFGLRGV